MAVRRTLVGAGAQEGQEALDRAAPRRGCHRPGLRHRLRRRRRLGLRRDARRLRLRPRQRRRALLLQRAGQFRAVQTMAYSAKQF